MRVMYNYRMMIEEDDSESTEISFRKTVTEIQDFYYDPDRKICFTGMDEEGYISATTVSEGEYDRYARELLEKGFVDLSQYDFVLDEDDDDEDDGDNSNNIISALLGGNP
ncbi:MAG: hypothetical protein IKQ27_03905 [Lachnospiraceae bacterium]|nr:hypothetical protein [Lachnospiraceae bacterium]